MKKGKRNEQPKAFTPVQWVNRSLDDNDIDRIEEWNLDDIGMLSALIGLVDTGHSITIRHNTSDDSFMASAVGNGDDCVNAGLGLSAYASDARSAIKVLLYKHHGIFDGAWPRNASAEKPKYR